MYPLSKPLSRLLYLETVEKLLLRMAGGVPVGGKAGLLLSIIADKIKVENEIIQRRILLAKKTSTQDNVLSRDSGVWPMIQLHNGNHFVLFDTASSRSVSQPNPSTSLGRRPLIADLEMLKGDIEITINQPVFLPVDY